MGWIDILATLDVCTNEINPALFFDEEGYEFLTFQMVNVISNKEHKAQENESMTGEDSNCHLWKVDNTDKILIVDCAQEIESKGEDYFDAF